MAAIQVWALAVFFSGGFGAVETPGVPKDVGPGAIVELRAASEEPVP